MPPSSTGTQKTAPQGDPALNQLSEIAALLDALLAQARKQSEQLQRLTRAVGELSTLVDGFTSSGSSFRSYQLDPMVVAYAAILGPILGDRIDANVPKGEAYIDEMLKGGAVMARQLLRNLDSYLSERGALDYLEGAAGDINTDPPADAQPAAG